MNERDIAKSILDKAELTLAGYEYLYYVIIDHLERLHSCPRCEGRAVFDVATLADGTCMVNCKFAAVIKKDAGVLHPEVLLCAEGWMLDGKAGPDCPAHRSNNNE